MTHVFDTQLLVPQRTLVRRAAVTILSPLKRPTGYLAAVKSFGGIARTYTDEVGIEQLVKAMGQTPSIAVATGQRNYETLAIGGKQASSDMQLLLYFATQHSRDGLSGRHEADSVAEADDTADPGLDVAMEHALELMHGQYLTATVGTVKQLQIVSEQELATLERITIWVQTYKLKLFSHTGSREFRTAEQLINSIHWRVTTDANEPNRPDPAVASSTVDVDTDPDP